MMNAALERIMSSELKAATLKGEALGEARGEARGEKRGEELGKKQGVLIGARQKGLAVYRNLIARGFSQEDALGIVELSADDLKEARST